MSPGVVIIAFVVSLLLVFGNQKGQPVKAATESSKRITGKGDKGPRSVVLASREELVQLLDENDGAELFVVKSASK